MAVSLFGHTYRVYTKLNAIVKMIFDILTQSNGEKYKITRSDNDLRVILRVIINCIADVNESQHDLLEFR